MRWSVPIVTVKGTVVRLHFTFILFLGWIFVAAYAQAGFAAALTAGAFLLLLFLSVVLHEFGHILTARRFGVSTPDVTLYPIGGIARLERIPEQPRQEFLIAMAGPAVNFAIAALLALLTGGLPGHVEMGVDRIGSDLAVHLAYANLAIGVFNLIPAFPMDGGRALRALLSARFGYARGTQIAAHVGQGLAILLGLYGLLIGHALLAVIALFVYIAAGSEAGMARLRGASLGAVASDLMITDLRALPVDATAGEAAEALMRTSQRDFPIVDPLGRVEGLVTREGIIQGLRSGPQTPLSAVLQKNVPALSPQHVADEAVRHLQEGAPAVAVTDAAGRLVGLITWDNLLEHLLIASAGKGGAAAAAGLRTAAAGAR